MTKTTCDGPTSDFRTDLIGLIPHMRAFARSLLASCMNLTFGAGTPRATSWALSSS